MNIVVFTITGGRNSQLQRAEQLFQRTAQQYFWVRRKDLRWLIVSVSSKLLFLTN